MDQSAADGNLGAGWVGMRPLACASVCLGAVALTRAGAAGRRSKQPRHEKSAPELMLRQLSHCQFESQLVCPARGCLAWARLLPAVALRGASVLRGTDDLVAATAAAARAAALPGDAGDAATCVRVVGSWSELSMCESACFPCPLCDSRIEAAVTGCEATGTRACCGCLLRIRALLVAMPNWRIRWSCGPDGCALAKLS